ncbi:hypothetical protein JRO89_XS11G0039800 [Xanthoceras sorbifolium]|uniref:Reverse transcriptase zinc-binding domain-containing protein n=1 Tax=Xanthoceras sorbifolium TaxID=99658 RepID=A0ABQ8HEK9_9ROSI|nr:hypothetical protein JRO89_XS11G0039800 [Xanthoceras sorbifolium]
MGGSLSKPTTISLLVKLPTDLCSKIDKINRDFLGGHTPDRMKLMSKSLLAKAGWRILQNDPGLLVRGVKWRVGNGSSILFWIYCCMDDGCTLLKFATILIEENSLNDKVSDYLDNGCWNIHKLSAVLPWHIVHKIASIHAGFDCSGADKVIWGYSGQGLFSVKSAYNNLLLDFDSPWQWRFIWKLKLPPRVQTFLWALLHNEIFTNNFMAGNSTIAAGGVFRDFEKNWLGRYAMNKDSGCIIEAELWGICEGLKIGSGPYQAWPHGIPCFLVRSGTLLLQQQMKTLVSLILSALRDLTKGDLILTVPKPALMTRQCLMEDDHKLSLALHNHPSLSSTQVSSRTTHIAWDDAGCLCPGGDLFNYAAPGEEANGFGDVLGWADDSSFLSKGDTFVDPVKTEAAIASSSALYAGAQQYSAYQPLQNNNLHGKLLPLVGQSYRVAYENG